MTDTKPSVLARVVAYLDEMDRVNAKARPHYADEAHEINGFPLLRSDLRSLATALSWCIEEARDHDREGLCVCPLCMLKAAGYSTDPRGGR